MLRKDLLGVMYGKWQRYNLNFLPHHQTSVSLPALYIAFYQHWYCHNLQWWILLTINYVPILLQVFNILFSLLKYFKLKSRNKFIQEICVCIKWWNYLFSLWLCLFLILSVAMFFVFSLCFYFSLCFSIFLSFLFLWILSIINLFIYWVVWSLISKFY